MSHLVHLVVVGMRVGGALGAVMTTQACKRIASSLRMHQDGGSVEGMGAQFVWCAENLGEPRLFSHRPPSIPIPRATPLISQCVAALCVEVTVNIRKPRVVGHSSRPTLIVACWSS